MATDYRTERANGAHPFADMFNERIVLLAEDYDGDPGQAEEGDDGVIAVYPLDPDALLRGLLDELSMAGVDVDNMLRRFGADSMSELLAGFKITKRRQP